MSEHEGARKTVKMISMKSGKTRNPPPIRPVGGEIYICHNLSRQQTEIATNALPAHDQGTILVSTEIDNPSSQYQAQQ
jgi:hypothetical protein